MSSVSSSRVENAEVGVRPRRRWYQWADDPDRNDDPRTQVPDPRRTKFVEWGWAEGPDIYAGMVGIFTFARPADFPPRSLIDLAGSDKATSDKERTREGKYINTRSALLIVAHP